MSQGEFTKGTFFPTRSHTVPLLMYSNHSLYSNSLLVEHRTPPAYRYENLVSTKEKKKKTINP